MRVDLALLEKIHEQIATGATGIPDSMAERLSISKRYLYVNLHYLKAKYGAPIAYSRARKTFFYRKEWKFYVGDITRVKAELLKELLDAIERL